MQSHEIEQLVRASLQAKIIEAFRSTPEMIDELVKAVLENEVDERGRKPDWNTKQRMPYLAWQARMAIEEVATDAVREYVMELREQIKDQVRKSLRSEQVADAMTAAILRATEHQYDIQVSFVVKEPQE